LVVTATTTTITTKRKLHTQLLSLSLFLSPTSLPILLILQPTNLNPYGEYIMTGGNGDDDNNDGQANGTPAPLDPALDPVLDPPDPIIVPEPDTPSPSK
jgi:hypothetical protein